MAKGKKTGGRDLKPGDRLNPLGRPPEPEDVKDAKKLSKVEFIRVANKFLYMTLAEIREVEEDKKSTMLDLLLASIILKGFDHGDQGRLTFFLDRIIGPVKSKIEHSGPDDGPIHVSEHLTEEELDRRAAKIMQRLKDKFKK